MLRAFFVACWITLLSATPTLAQTTDAPAADAPSDAAVLDYPETKTVDTVDVYHGTVVPDPYRWLEDLGAPETKAWIDAQNEVTFDYLSSISERDAIEERLTELYDYPKYSVPNRKGDRLFFSKNDGLQDQSVVYVQPVGEASPEDASSDEATSANGGAEPRVLLDPNTWSEDGTVALSALRVSDDGRYAAYGISESGSDWRSVRVRDVETGEDLPETLRWVKFSTPAWAPDGDGFYYGRYPEPAEGETYEATVDGMQLYYHALGTPQSEDRLVYERPDDPKLGFAPQVTDDGRYLVITAWKGTAEENGLYVKDLTDPDADIRRVLDDFDASYQMVGSAGSTFYLLTNREAPNKRLVALDVETPEAGFEPLIPASDAVLQSVTHAGGRFVVHALDDVKARLTVHAMDGTLERTIALPAIGSVGGIRGDAGRDELFYAFTSYTYPTTIYRADLAVGTEAVFRRPEIPGFDADRYTVEQAFFESTDGTEVPMFIVHRKGLARDGTHPALMYGYGGFNISLTPSFSTSRLVWLEMGGVYAVPNLRGGGEYGQAWHEAGMLDNKQTVFDDFAAAGEYLIEAGYTSREKLAIQGGSNGGLLTGASITQRPDLFGAAIVSVGVLDMLRYHEFTIGWAWVPEYGSSDDPAQFEYLYAYSPLHNVEDGAAYPPTLITTADTDDRVVPGHSYKFAARLQAAQGGDAPILLRVETKAGHGAGTPTSKIIDAQADRYAFLARTLGMDVPAEMLGVVQRR